MSTGFAAWEERGANGRRFPASGKAAWQLRNRGGGWKAPVDSNRGRRGMELHGLVNVYDFVAVIAAYIRQTDHHSREKREKALSIAVG